MAGLPKVALHLGAMVLIGAILVGGLSRAQETPGAPTLEDLIARIETAQTLSAEEKSQVVGSLSAAVTGGYLTTAQALAWLDTVQLEALTPEAAEFAVEALTMAVAALTTGRVDPEGALTALAVATTAQDLALLKTMLAELAAPPGISQALANVATGYDKATIATLLDETQELILDGVPPGIVLRVAKDALRSQTDLTTLQEGLATLGTLIADGTAPGRAANQIVENGHRGQNREHERNQNAHQGPGFAPEEEEERNQNAAEHGQGNPGKGNKG
ncbi:hypothetical protein H5T53_00725 [Candidatus Bipolaricaulota bacterium]|nr:hypothetical protein [Candidatus Bipolaricaulota bacterium]